MASLCRYFLLFDSRSTTATSNAQPGAASADGEDNTWYSIFPVENEELVYGTWEEEVIWDAENMPKIPKPKILTLDPNDENIILGIPDDVDPSKITRGTLRIHGHTTLCYASYTYLHTYIHHIL